VTPAWSKPVNIFSWNRFVIMIFVRSSSSLRGCPVNEPLTGKGEQKASDGPSAIPSCCLQKPFGDCAERHDSQVGEGSMLIDKQNASSLVISRGAHVAIILAFMMFGTGCVFFNPFVKPLNPDGSDVTDKTSLDNVGKLCGEIIGDKANLATQGVCDSIKYVEGYRLAYLNAAGAHSKLRNAVAWGAIPLSGVALYYGLTGKAPSNGERIARFGIASGVAYSLASFSTSTVKQQIYVNGAQAMSCLMMKAAPLVVPATKQDQLKGQVETLDEMAAVLSTDIDNARSAGVDESDLSAAQRVLADAHSASTRALNFLETLARAAYLVHVRADSVAQMVDQDLIKEEPTLSSLLDLAKNLSAVSGSFGQSGFPVAKPPTQPAVAPKALVAGAPTDPKADAKKKLDDASIATTNAANAVKSTLRLLAGATKAMDAIEVGKSQDFSVPNSNAKDAVPTIEVQGPNVDAIKVDPIKVSADRKTFIITVEGIKATGQDAPTLVIKDGGGSLQHQVKIVVTAAAKTPATTPATPTASRTLTDLEKKLSPQAIRDIQCGVGMPQKEVDCKLGPITFGFVKAFRASETPPPAKGQEDVITQAVQSAADQKANSKYQCDAIQCP
jgi:hypothetical protein